MWKVCTYMCTCKQTSYCNCCAHNSHHKKGLFKTLDPLKSCLKMTLLSCIRVWKGTVFLGSDISLQKRCRIWDLTVSGSRIRQNLAQDTVSDMKR